MCQAPLASRGLTQHCRSTGTSYEGLECAVEYSNSDRNNLKHQKPPPITNRLPLTSGGRFTTYALSRSLSPLALSLATSLQPLVCPCRSDVRFASPCPSLDTPSLSRSSLNGPGAVIENGVVPLAESRCTTPPFTLLSLASSELDSRPATGETQASVAVNPKPRRALTGRRGRRASRPRIRQGPCGPTNAAAV